MFRRKQVSIEPVDPDAFVDDLDPEDRAYEDAELNAELDRLEALEASPSVSRPQGPWDAGDAPETDEPMLDLGGLHVPVPAGCEVRVDVSPEGEVVAATVVLGESSLQVNAFAAPRHEGIWGEVRSEIAEALRAGQGTADEVDGPLGTELLAGVPTEVDGGGVALAPARFLGVDGPRWFLRGLVTGPAATDPALADPLVDVLRGVVVHRGGDPMAVRDPLPLRIPQDLIDNAVPDGPDGGPDAPTLAPPERGPEITEIG